MKVEFRNQKYFNPDRIFNGERTFNNCFRFILNSFLKWKEVNINSAVIKLGVNRETVHRHLKTSDVINHNLLDSVLIALNINPKPFIELANLLVEKKQYNCVIFTSDKIIFSRSISHE